MPKDDAKAMMLNLSPRYGQYRAAKITAITAWIVLPMVAGVAGMELANLSYDSPLTTQGWKVVMGVVIALLVALPLAALAVRSAAIAAGRDAPETQRAWLRKLPFHVEGYLEILNRSDWMKSAGSPGLTVTSSPTPDTYYLVNVHVSHKGSAPPHAALKDLVAKFGDPLSVKEVSFSDDGTWDLGYSGSEGAMKTARATQRVVGELLLPLHQRFPLARVTFRITNL